MRFYSQSEHFIFIDLSFTTPGPWTYTNHTSIISFYKRTSMLIQICHFFFVFERVFIQADVKRSFTKVYHNNRKVLEDFKSQLTHSIVVDYRSSLNQHLKRGPKTNNLPDNREPWNQVQLDWHLTTIRAAAFGKQLDPFLSPTRMQLEPRPVQIRMLLQLIVA